MASSTSNKRIAFKIPFNLPMKIVAEIIARSSQWIMDPEWIRHRINIFMTYTLKSLKAQTNQSFVAYILYYTPSETLILNELKQYPSLPKHIQFIREEDYDKLINPYLTNSLFYYEVELGSDDLYHRNFVQYLFDYTPKPTTKILICQDGYVLSSQDNILAEYFNFSSCFNCWIYKSTDYLNGIRYSYQGYTGAILLEHEIIPWRAYINHSHKTNIAFSYQLETTTPWGKDLAYVGKIINDPTEKQSLLNEFLGIPTKLAIFHIKFNIAYNVPGNKFEEARLTQEWIDYRLDIFMKYTYPSLIHQTNQNFIALIHYDVQSEKEIKTSLMRYPDIPPHIKFVPDIDNAIKIEIQNYTSFLLIHLDSDNIFHPTIVDKFLSLDNPDLQYIICQAGYILDATTHQFAYYHHPMPNTFYAFIYSTKDYLSGYRIPIPTNAYGDIINQFQYLSKVNYINFADPLFIITIHEKVMTNVLTDMFYSQTARYLIDDPNEQSRILKEFELPTALLP